MRLGSFKGLWKLAGSQSKAGARSSSSRVFSGSCRGVDQIEKEMERQGVEHWLLRKTIKEEKAIADAEIDEYQQRQWKAYHISNKEFSTCEKHCREQRELLRAIEDLAQQEREMYELDNRKDQVMTVCKVALGM
jgi:hypothetical protein